MILKINDIPNKAYVITNTLSEYIMENTKKCAPKTYTFNDYFNNRILMFVDILMGFILLHFPTISMLITVIIIALIVWFTIFSNKDLLNFIRTVSKKHTLFIVINLINNYIFLENICT